MRLSYDGTFSYNICVFLFQLGNNEPSSVTIIAQFFSVISDGHGGGSHCYYPLTMNDYSRHRNSATCYQLAQSALTGGGRWVHRFG